MQTYRHIVLEPKTGRTRLVVNLPAEAGLSLRNTLEKIAFVGTVYGVFVTGIWLYLATF